MSAATSGLPISVSKQKNGMPQYSGKLKTTIHKVYASPGTRSTVRSTTDTPLSMVVVAKVPKPQKAAMRSGTADPVVATR